MATAALKNSPRIPEGAQVVQPHPGWQVQALSWPGFEMLAGGQAGPGKTWFLVIDALGLQYMSTPLGKSAIEIPDYRAVLFRRKSTQLSKLIDECKKYYTAAPFNATFTAQRRGDPGPCFEFASGAKVFLCHMEQETDKENHQGIEYQYVGFDELTHFTVTQYTYLFSRCRSTVEHLTPRVRSTANPTGPGLVWVKKRFIRYGATTLTPGKTYWFKHDFEHPIERNPAGVMCAPKEQYGKRRIFIPGRLDENTHLQDPEAYRSAIMQMGKKYAAALLNGDWDALVGDFFDELDQSTMEVEPFLIPDTWGLIASIDPGWASPCSFGLMARDFEGNLYRLFTYYVADTDPRQHAQAIRQMIGGFEFTNGRWPDLFVSGRDAFAKKDRHAVVTSELTFADLFRDQGIVLQPAQTDRVPGWWAWKQKMRDGKWFYFRGYNDPLIEEMVAAEHDERNPEDIRGRGNDPEVSDHALDEARYGIMAARKVYREDAKAAEPRKPFEGKLNGKPERPPVTNFWE